jgi:hypothetical protein
MKNSIKITLFVLLTVGVFSQQLIGTSDESVEIYPDDDGGPRLLQDGYIIIYIEQSRFSEETLGEETLGEVYLMEIGLTTTTITQDPQIKNLKEKLPLHLSENLTLRPVLLLSLLKIHWD